MRKKILGLDTGSFFGLESLVWILILGYIFYSPEVGQVAEEAVMPTPAPRFIYFKLPIEQTEYHWIFKEREAYLAGTLTLRIHSADGDESITVFDNGIISEDWGELGCRDDESNSEIYFGFKSRRKYSTTNWDRVDMVLLAPIDVTGVGPHAGGIMRAGEYRATNRFKVFSSDSDTAFLIEKKWEPQWELEITQETGWMEERARQAD